LLSLVNETKIVLPAARVYGVALVIVCVVVAIVAMINSL
jgi:hypothetical protein